MTIIELIVVMTIVFILAVIATIATKAGIKAAKNSSSVFNLKQLNTASLLYAEDHNGYTPPQVTFDNVLKLPVGTIKERLTNHPASLWKRALLPYKVSADTFYAPLDPLAKSTSANNDHLTDHLISSYYHDFAIYSKFKDSLGFYRLKLDEIAEPSSTINLSESYQGIKEIGGKRWAIPYNETTSNVLHFDGSVGNVPVPQ